MTDDRFGVGHAIQRLTGSQSAFAMRDLISLAMADAPPSELGRVYDSYTARTMRAMATSYAVLALAAGTLVTYVAKDQHDWRIGLALGTVIALAVLTGLFQHAELAQLPREFAEATRLLAILRELRGHRVELGTPFPRPGGSVPGRWLAGIVMVAALCGIAVAGGLAVGCKNDATLPLALAAIAGVVMLLSRLGAELRPSPKIPSTAKRNAERGTPLVQRIGQYRLDDYVTRSKVTDHVNHCIKDAYPARSAVETVLREHGWT